MASSQKFFMYLSSAETGKNKRCNNIINYSFLDFDIIFLIFTGRYSTTQRTYVCIHHSALYRVLLESNRRGSCIHICSCV